VENADDPAKQELALMDQPLSIDWRSLHGDAFRGRKALITGGAGFIGSHLAEALCALDAAVIVMDDLSGGSVSNLADFGPLEFVNGTILDSDTLARCMRGCDFVFHLAALGSVPASVAHPREFHEANVTGTLNVLEAARDAKTVRR
jgi:nucleoside-diphosphate-sugar epimerase